MTQIINVKATGAILWGAHKHKKGYLGGLVLDGLMSGAATQITDSFSTDSGYTSGGSAYSAEDLVSGNAVVKFQATVLSGQVQKFSKQDLGDEGIPFLGRAALAGTSGAVSLTAIYELK